MTFILFLFGHYGPDLLNSKLACGCNLIKAQMGESSVADLLTMHNFKVMSSAKLAFWGAVNNTQIPVN